MRLDTGQSFNFLPIPTDIHFGCGQVRTLPDRLKALGARHVFVVTDPGVKAAGLADRVTQPLAQAGLAFTLYDRVTADSGSDQIVEARDALKAVAADVVVGIGGGSSLDTAKAVAALATNPGSPFDYLGLHKVTERALPTVAIPTTSGTGSEVSLWSVFTDDRRKVKVAIGGINLFPTIALCDPELTYELPPSLTAATGMDALGHAIECFTNNACQPISGALALRAIELIGAHLRGAVLNGADRAARYALMLASTLAGMAMNPTRLGLAHALAMPLGSGDLKIPHGLAVAVTLAPVMRFNAPAAPERFVEVTRALGGNHGHGGAMESAMKAPALVAELGESIGIPASLAGHGLRESHVAEVVEEAMKSGNVLVNPRRTSKDELTAILRSVL
jgi:alcohol dehydrogenase class IV